MSQAETAARQVARSLPTRTQVVIVGGGPVGLSAAVELGQRGVRCLVIEPRRTVSHARPRCKTVNVRTMEHLRRWGLAETLREVAPLPIAWSQDVVFCTSLTGRELSRFSGVFGLKPEGERFAEIGQQAPQYVLEELLREAVSELAPCELGLGWRVTDVAQTDAHVAVAVVGDSGQESQVSCDYVIGCDGGRSIIRERIGAAYEGDVALRPNFGLTFRSSGLWDLVRHGRAVQYWVVNEHVPAVMGPIDQDGTWWLAAIGVDADTGQQDPLALVTAAAGCDVDAEILSTDPWTAHMQLADRVRVGRVFLAGDAAHLNPPFGGHGLNTGIGDAVDLGWKLAATLQGWGGERLLDSYERERRPVHAQVIEEAKRNMSVLPSELYAAEIDSDGSAGQSARRTANERIQETKSAEFHAVDFVLGMGYPDSSIIAGDETTPDGRLPVRAGFRLPHSWLSAGRSVYDELGPNMSLLVLDELPSRTLEDFERAAQGRGVPLSVVDLRRDGQADRYGARLVLVRPDQHVVWQGASAPADCGALLDIARGAADCVLATKRSSCGD